MLSACMHAQYYHTHTFSTMTRTLLVCTLALLAVLAVSASKDAGSSAKSLKTLVLLDNQAYKSSHSSFFNALKARGHSLTYHHLTDDSVRLERYGSYYYDNLILFTPTAEDLGEAINTEAIVNFIDSGRSILIAVHENVTEPIREIANQVGIDIDEEGTSVIDHAHFDLSDSTGPHTLIASSNIIKNAPVLTGSSKLSPVLFRGIGHAAQEGSRLITRIVTGSDSTYSHAPLKRVDEYPQSAGRETLLVTAVQTRNNARVVFSGSIEFFSNKFFASGVNTASGEVFDKSGNEALATELSKWVFHERGLLRATQITHKHVDKQEVNPKAYRVTDNIEFSVLLEEWNGPSGTWQPFTGEDVQLEFTMIDPYLRTTLTHNNAGVYSTKFVVPDVYGVFKFVINYHRPGFSNLELSEQVSVHPFRHNEFERFIDVAYPYYLSAFTIMGAFFLFGILFLYQKDN